jgi:hypothetical protein
VGIPVVATEQVTQEPFVIVIVFVPLFFFVLLTLFTMDAAVAALRSELAQQFNATIQVLQAEISDLCTHLQAHPETHLKLILPDPEKFTGQTLKFNIWLPSIKAKLHIDSLALGDPIAQFYYVYLNLDSSVQAMVLPQLSQTEEAGVWDHNTILDQLSCVYDNLNKVQKAEDKLLALKQGSDDSVAVYIAQFERVLYEACGQDWPDANKISVF